MLFEPSATQEDFAKAAALFARKSDAGGAEKDMFADDDDMCGYFRTTPSSWTNAPGRPVPARASGHVTLHCHVTLCAAGPVGLVIAAACCCRFAASDDEAAQPAAAKQAKTAGTPATVGPAAAEAATAAAAQLAAKGPATTERTDASGAGSQPCVACVDCSAPQGALRLGHS